MKRSHYHFYHVILHTLEHGDKLPCPFGVVSMLGSPSSVVSAQLRLNLDFSSILVNNFGNKIAKNLKIFVEIDQIRSRGVLCQL
jgi:hypothetical protein